MNARAKTLSRSTVGKKIAMALAGLVMIVFLFFHMIGNLLVFAGPEAINAYGEFLQHGTHGGIWVLRAGLLAALGVHIWAVVGLYRKSRAARSTRYQGGRENQKTNAAALSMVFGGLALLAYIVYHIMHFTIGNVHADFIRGDVYHNVVVAFSNPVVVGVYVAGQVFLGLHLYHGAWSMFQTGGFNHPKWNQYRRPFAVGLTLLIVGGFLLVPLAVITGIVS